MLGCAFITAIRLYKTALFLALSSSNNSERYFFSICTKNLNSKSPFWAISTITAPTSGRAFRNKSHKRLATEDDSEFATDMSPQPCHDDRMENSSVKTIATSKPSQRPHESSLSSSSPEVSVPTVTTSLLPTQEAKTGTDVSQHELKQRRFSRQASGAVEIALDGAEEQLFRILVETVRAYESGEIELSVEQLMTNQERRESCADIELDYPRPVQLDVRVAGGWVRDKLLGLQTHDVDIAINRLTGVQFASLVQQYLKRQREKEEESTDLPAREKKNRSCGKMGVIAANPDQSKHLETATMKVCGIEVDFCNLRAEEMYQANSRIPMVKFGSPHEDANRRDFTVNALFYNLKTSCVEDWTGRGLADLEKAQLVTPLDPLATFSDDPLRVLRAIRFAVRYNFSLDAALERAAMCQSIHKALHVKVSRERVGKELEGMLSGKGADPAAALDAIARLKLAGSVFCVPKAGEDRVAVVSGLIAGRPYEETWQRRIYDTHDGRHTREMGWEEARALLHLLPPVQAAFLALAAERPAPATVLDTRLLPVAVFLLPFRTMHYEEINKSNNRKEKHAFVGSGKSYSAATYIFRQGIKFKNKDVAAMATLQDTADRMVALLDNCTAAATTGNDVAGPNLDRLAAGLLLRATKDLWLTSLVLATVLKIRDQQQQQQQRQKQKHQEAKSVVDWIKVSCSAYKAILDLDLDECWKVKPLLDGKAVIAALQLPRGPAVGIFLDEQVKWMLQHPTGSVHDCREYLLSFKRRQEEQEQVRDQCVGVSDGVAPSSTVQGGKTVQHFSKRMHVESRLDNTPSSRGS